MDDESDFKNVVIKEEVVSAESDVETMETETDADTEKKPSIKDERKNESEEADRPKRAVYLPGKPLKKDEFLEPDYSAYLMLHEADAGSPCLSFDIIPDNLGTSRENFPHTCYVVAGTQAVKKKDNAIVVMKFSNLRQTLISKENEDDSTDSSSSDEEVNVDGISPKTPVMNSSTIWHYGAINRIRTCQHNNTMLAAAWSELGRVNIFDLKRHLNAVENYSTLKVKSVKNKFTKAPYGKQEKENPLFTFTGHIHEGYAMDWSKTVPGVLVTGDCSSKIHVWTPRESSWHVDLRPMKSHKRSVEDLQWSPDEKNVFASCSVDKSIKIWDIRAAPNQACMLTVDDAHFNDVNVISWNKTEPLISSGGDDGYLKVWDLRQFKKDAAVATFKHHTEPVTTVEWHPSDSSVLASGGEDNQIAIWDLSVERDNEHSEEEIKEIPPQLLFIHLGNEVVKELHWHPQIPGAIISTGESGFSIFKTINV